MLIDEDVPGEPQLHWVKAGYWLVIGVDALTVFLDMEKRGPFNRDTPPHSKGASKRIVLARQQHLHLFAGGGANFPAQ